jgi:hypothetical protein
MKESFFSTEVPLVQESNKYHLRLVPLLQVYVFMAEKVYLDFKLKINKTFFNARVAYSSI